MALDEKGRPKREYNHPQWNLPYKSSDLNRNPNNFIGTLSPSQDWPLIKAGFWNHYNWQRGELDEPTFLGFKVMFSFENPSSPLFNTPNSETGSVKSDQQPIESAYHYFKNIVMDDDRAEAVKIFKKELKFVSQRSPWYFQSIEGLNEAMKLDPKTPLYWDENILTINTLEGLDMRIHSLMSLYSHIYFSRNHWKEMLPKNLRKFQMFVYVNEIRDFIQLGNELQEKQFDNTGNSSNFQYPDEEAQKWAEKINEFSTNIIFKFNDCQFKVNEYGDFLSSVSNSEYNQVENKIQINYNNVEVFSQFPWIGGVQENREASLVPGFENKGDNRRGRIRTPSDALTNKANALRSFGEQTRQNISDLPQRAQSLGIGFASDIISTNFLNPLLLGNVYGSNPQTQLNNLLTLNTLPR